MPHDEVEEMHMVQALKNHDMKAALGKRMKSFLQTKFLGHMTSVKPLPRYPGALGSNRPPAVFDP